MMRRAWKGVIQGTDIRLLLDEHGRAKLIYEDAKEHNWWIVDLVPMEPSTESFKHG